MPCVDRQCAAVGLPNLWASSVMAHNSSTLNDGRSVNELAVLPPVAVILM